MKTNNPAFYNLVKSCFIAFCEESGLKPYINPVYFEHEGFSCSAENNEDETIQFRAVDAACQLCADGGVDYCFNCKRNCQIDFEEI